MLASAHFVVLSRRFLISPLNQPDAIDEYQALLPGEPVKANGCDDKRAAPPSRTMPGAVGGPLREGRWLHLMEAPI